MNNAYLWSVRLFNTQIVVHGTNTERFLNLCAANGIYLLDTQKNADILYAKTCTIFEKKLQNLAEKAEVSIAFVKREGIIQKFFMFKFRVTFWLMPLVAFVYFFSMSHYVWRVDIVGNQSISTEFLTEYITEAGFGFGAPKSLIDEEALEFMLRENFPQITWVNVLLEGTHLCISLKENDSFLYENYDISVVSANLIADCDGEIISVITRSGIPLVSAGDTVSDGSVLVSGTVPIYNDYGDVVVSENYVIADADIEIKTTVTVSFFEPYESQSKNYYDEGRNFPFVLIGDLWFSLYKEKSEENSTDVYTDFRQLVIGDDFFFPIYYGSITQKDFYFVDILRGEEELKNILTEEYERYCLELTGSGILIVSDEISYQTNEEGVTLSSLITIIKPAGYKQYYSLEDTQSL